MYHMLAYSVNTFGVTDQDTAAAPDPIFTITNGHYLPSKQLNLYGGYFGGVNLTRVKLKTPRMQQVCNPVLVPINNVILPPDRPHLFDRRTNPIILNAVEEVQILMSIGGAANAFNVGILMVGTSIDPIPQGDIFTLHGVSTTAAVADAWTQVQVLFDQNIPAGTYVAVHSQVQSTNAIAHRWIFQDQAFRPGFLSVGALTNETKQDYYYGGWGRLGQFNTYTFPNLEVYANGTDNAHDVLLSFIRIA